MKAPASKEIIDGEHAAAERIVHAEISKYQESRYWIGSKERHLASVEDYDRKKFATDLESSFPHLHSDAILSLIDSKIYRLHLR